MKNRNDLFTWISINFVHCYFFDNKTRCADFSDYYFDNIKLKKIIIKTTLFIFLPMYYINYSQFIFTYMIVIIIKRCPFYIYIEKWFFFITNESTPLLTSKYASPNDHSTTPAKPNPRKCSSFNESTPLLTPNHASPNDHNTTPAIPTPCKSAVASTETRHC